MHSGANAFVTYWQQLLYPGDPGPHHGDIGSLKEWGANHARRRRWMLILLALCLAGPWLVRGRAHRGMTLFAATAPVLLFFRYLHHGARTTAS